MNKLNKFGTFGGVFTPSILTILGVIMYMRLGTIAGNSSSIVMLLLIILFAHIISITTGLSVSSISTDKKIKAGGIYYMLTRSLGFPIGGAIGITLFVATSLSISLYLIGFAESFFPVIQDLVGIEEITTNHLRIGGSCALLLVLFIAMKSTGFAIKIQYVILSMIILSLVSIFLGSSDGLQVGSDEIGNVSFAVLFGIFFPAVTGFTAGVAMSGDLRDPKKSIPWGTMLAIFVGMLVYIILAIFIFYSIDKDILRTNNSALIQFGFIPALVIGGVWGATLSSALGGILGAPRILQAMSLDNITPKIFSKGNGLNNEPRNAIILTFVISELGILIGELNLIAEVVAMFYMAAYLFINITCFLEQWASPDFRPKLKIPIWVSLIGAVATFLLMVQLNLAATLASVLIIVLIFLWLTRKQLVLGTGDVWQSVWSSVVKLGLKHLNKKSAHQRNWQPNILLFSGGTKARPHLLELSKSITGRSGMVSNFDLIEEESSEILFPKDLQSDNENIEIDNSIFHRRLYCKNIFKGIEAIASTYGFSGIEPNTVLMGWARNTEDPLWFAQMTRKLHKLDYNLMYLDYDKDKGFGLYRQVDIWWTKDDDEISFTLQLIKLLVYSSSWESAKVKIFYINNNNSQKVIIDKIISRIVSNDRLDIEYVVINNEVEKKDKYQLIKLYSSRADLIIMSMPKIIENVEKKYVSSTNKLLDVIGTVLIIKASSRFVIKNLINTEIESNYVERVSSISSKEIIKYPLAKSGIISLDNKISEFNDGLYEINENFSSTIYNTISDAYVNLSKLIDKKMTNNYNAEFFQEISSIINDFSQNRVEIINMELSNILSSHFDKLLELNKMFPIKINIPILEEHLKEKNTDSFYIRKQKNRLLKKLQNGKDLKSIKVNLFEISKHHIENAYLVKFREEINAFGVTLYSVNNKIKEFVIDVIDNSNKNEINLAENIKDLINIELKSFSSKINRLGNVLLNSVLVDSIKLNIKDIIISRQEENYYSKVKNRYNDLELYPFYFKKNQDLILNQLNCNISICGAKLELNSYLIDYIDILNDKILSFDLSKIDDKDEFIDKFLVDFSIEQILSDIKLKTKYIISKYCNNTEIISLKSINSFSNNQIHIKTINLDTSKLVFQLFKDNVISFINKNYNKINEELKIIDKIDKTSIRKKIKSLLFDKDKIIQINNEFLTFNNVVNNE